VLARALGVGVGVVCGGWDCGMRNWGFGVEEGEGGKGAAAFEI
jgi:hypothetical protein